MIPRYLQDSTLPLHPHDYAFIPLCITLDSLLLCLINANGFVTAYTQHITIASSPLLLYSSTHHTGFIIIMLY
jgi:hypothetical protein